MTGVPVGCPAGTAIAGRGWCIVACSPSAACAGANYCSTRCAACAEGYYQLSGACAQCPNSAGALFLGVALLVAALAGAGYAANKFAVSTTAMSIAVDYFQVRGGGGKALGRVVAGAVLRSLRS
jgi:hypothetical protein